ncbi:M16 family metallopeptidase [Desulfohalovibrio reitneri]|uniref:M16 family metallopeptidase n=1 Tax=Desulfohalovibrio reitneri TaxID=1307759 RepID=UPI0005548178|nr:pitrilysin family protein [Desulfohalovibrio reitneri]
MHPQSALRAITLAAIMLLAAVGCEYMGTIEGYEAEAGANKTATTASAEEREKQPPVPRQGEGPKVTVLENGLTVLTLQDDRFPLASMRLYVHAGSAYEDPEQAGISHLLEHMVFKGEGEGPSGAIARKVESVGGNLNAGTSFDYTVYYVDVPSTEWKLGLDVVNDMAFGLSVDPEELKSEQQVVLSELERGEDNPSQRQFKMLQKLVFADTPYERPIIGFRETVPAITRQDILDYVVRLYQPQSMLLVVVGDVDEAEVLAEADRLFGDLRNDREVHPPREIPIKKLSGADGGSPSGPAVRVEEGDWNKAYVSLAFPIPGQRSQEVAGLEVLAHLLGGDRTSRLYREYKYEKQMVDSISASALTLERAGVLVIQAVCDPDDVDPFVRSLAGDLSTFDAADFSKEELERARLNLEDSLYRTKETFSGLASKLGYFQFFEGGVEAEENYLYSLRTVDESDLQGLAETYLDPDRLALAALTPEGKGPDAEALRGTIGEAWRAETGARTTAKAMPEHGETGGARGEPEVVTLESGDTVVLLPDETLPYAAVDMLFAGGDRLLDKDEQGLAALTASMLGRGAGDMSATAYQDYLANRAASVSARSRRDTFGLAARFPSRFSDEVLPVFRQTVLSPRFAPEEMDRAKREQIASIKRKQDQPLGLAFRRLFPFLYQSPGYGWLHLGEPEQVSGYTTEQVASFWQTQQARPFVFTACGTFDRDEILDLARTLAADLEHEPGAELAEFQPPVWGEDKELTLTMPGRNQTHLVRVYPVPGEKDEDTAGLSLMRDILAGQSGLLFTQLRDKQGLGYSVTAFLWQAPETGFLAFYIGTDPDKKQQALDSFDRIAEDIKSKPLDKAELERAANLMQGEYYRNHQTLRSRASAAAGLTLRGLGLDHPEELIAKAREITPAQLQDLASKYLESEESYLVTVSPEESGQTD